MNIIDIITLSWITAAVITIPLIVIIIVSKAIKKRIIPEFSGKGLTVDKYQWICPIGTGDFNDDQISIKNFAFLTGTPVISFYVYIYYNKGGLKKRLTARIDTLFLFIRKVTYSEEF